MQDSVFLSRNILPCPVEYDASQTYVFLLERFVFVRSFATGYSDSALMEFKFCGAAR